MPKPEKYYLDQIALRLFGLKSNKWTVQKCPARDFKKMEAFELNGDASHSDHRHWCSECQCRNYAGEGTKGEFWGDGEDWDKIGHFGVGWCKDHEDWLLKQKYHTPYTVLEYARTHMDALMSLGKLSKTDPTVIAKHEADVSERKRKLVRNMNDAQELTDKLVQHLRNSEKKDSTVIATALKSLEDRLADCDFKEEKDRTKFIKELRDTVLVASSLTEAAGGRIIPMTDKTMFLMADKFINSMSKLNLDEYRMGKDSYVHVDEITIRIPKMQKIYKGGNAKIYEFFLNYDQNKHDFKQFLDDMEVEWNQSNYELWTNLNAGTR